MRVVGAFMALNVDWYDVENERTWVWVLCVLIVCYFNYALF